LEVENPTAEDSGASITDRLERYLAADDAPAPKAETPEPAATEKPEGDSTEPETQSLSTADLAEVLGIDEDSLDVGDDGKLIIKAKIDGSESKAKLADLLKTYQLQGHAENKVREAAEARKAADARMQEVEQAAQARIQQVESMAKVAASELMREFQSINWPALEQADPGQAALLRQKFQERNAQLQGVFQNVNAERQRATEGIFRQRAEYLQKEMQRLPEVIPEWRDRAVAQKESQEIIDWGRSKGFSDAQLKALNESSAEQIAIVRKAMMFDKLQTAKPAIENKVRKAPVIVKPGQQQATSKEAKIADLRQQVRRSGGKGGSVAAYLLATGKV